MDQPAAFIRHAKLTDKPALYQICLQTAKAGEDATGLYSDQEYPGQLYVVPYLLFEPQFAFVLEMDQQVVGYVVATADTAHFEKTLGELWWPQLRTQYASREEIAPLDHKVLGQIRNPSQASPELLERWPAHLHINLLPQAQSGGWGRKMMTHQLCALKDAGVSGVHLGVNLANEKVCQFYEKVGFETIFRSHAIYMGLRLDEE
ncbi:GNAT family N-acetyltransferase [Celerinatantimonas diazotrophica]|uniref:Acetyltransferase (GNAT) family protein n=1 Tax=Celerinatantimonas diazotrophica TaxID=412034 RepID=A0A4R1K195_9GAMM|nr:GNAT family N-acetyltransferase [Celerinatantimonas diazotrophica]TCK57722.1 acetyltransferase (GNAT) family protein [Celerinatantimonas diazotrophica]CAG9298216.1 Putative acetyltransferase OgpAT [Celerinatantimonas diazotrophica]